MGETHTQRIFGTDEQLEPPYHLILLDDNEHTYHYVVLMLGAIFGYSAVKAFAIACVVDSQGQAILMTGSHDEPLLDPAIEATLQKPLRARESVEIVRRYASART